MGTEPRMAPRSSEVLSNSDLQERDRADPSVMNMHPRWKDARGRRSDGVKLKIDRVDS